jgi:hypothetical protein
MEMSITYPTTSVLDRFSEEHLAFRSFRIHRRLLA